MGFSVVGQTERAIEVGGTRKDEGVAASPRVVSSSDVDSESKEREESTKGGELSALSTIEEMAATAACCQGAAR